MDNLMSPESVRLGVEIATEDTVYRATREAANWTVFNAIWDSMGSAVEWAAFYDVAVAVAGAVREGPPHPNLSIFIEEIEQNWSRT